MMFASAPSGLNPYSITEYSEFGPTSFTDTTGTTTVGSPLVSGEKTLVMLNVSQSNGANALASAYTATNPTKVLTVSPFDGIARQFKDPVLGSTHTTGSMLGKIGDLMIAAGWDKVIWFSIAVGGTYVAAWAPRGVLHHRLLSGIKRMRGFINNAPAGTIIKPGVMSLLGETDSQNGTAQAAWQADFNQMAAALPGCGVSWPWFVGKQTVIGGAPNATIQAAQAAVVNGTTIFAGADGDSVPNRYDGVHFNDTGRDLVAALWRDKFVAFYP